MKSTTQKMEIYIETERLFLRQYESSDLESFIDLNQDEQVMEFFAIRNTAEESTRIVENIKKSIDTKKYGFFAVEEKATGEFVGYIGINDIGMNVDFKPGVEIAWRLLPKYWGKGYATEGALACLDFAKNTIGLSKVYAFTSVPNVRSASVMQKIGMKYVKEFGRPTIPVDHPLHLHVLYEINF